jgi:hypothetical protein
MSRVITKPSDIKILTLEDLQKQANQGHSVRVVNLEQCKQIAEAYAKDYMYGPYLSDPWESLFNSPEWGGKDV